jgi:hypothetical protein
VEAIQEEVDLMMMMSKMKEMMMDPHGKTMTKNEISGKEHHFQKRKRYSTTEKTSLEMYHIPRRTLEKANLRNQLFLTTGPSSLPIS